VAGESASVAAGPLYPGASYRTEALRPTEEFFMAPRRGRHLQLTQASAQLVQDYGHVQIEMGVHPQDHLIRAVQPVHTTDRSHVRCSFRDRCHYYWPDDAQNGQH
jgi:hypothetical protein